MLAYWLAFCLRFDFSIPREEFEKFRLSLPFLLVIKLAVFLFTRQFQGWWRHVTFADFTALLKASIIALLLVTTIDHFLFPLQVPRAVLILDSVIAIGCLALLRASWRMVREDVMPVFATNDCRIAMIIGADESSGKLAQQINSHPELGYRIGGFIDSNKKNSGSYLGQIPVLGSEQQLSEIARTYGASDILVSAERLTGQRLRSLISQCDKSGLDLKIIPAPEERFNGGSRIPIRDIQINDLLRRDPVNLDKELIENLICDRSVLVTGAGGSIGSEICRQLLKFHPRSLILVDQAENNTFMIHRELEGIAETNEIELIPFVADVTDHDRLRAVFLKTQPDLVFHAAAHKHVPLMEINVGEALKNNVLGTKYVADLAAQFGAERFVFISTDKAVNPTSVMGVTKQLAERYVHSLSQTASNLNCVAVRFGNVLGSVGSVVPIFQEQIRRGGPITITDKRMERYFMTIPEASQLVLQAAAMGNGGEIFVLDMGNPVKIVDLARDLIRLSGLSNHAIEIAEVGIRPGEKLFEELYFEDENTLATNHSKVRTAYHRFFEYSSVCQMIEEIKTLVDKNDNEIRRRLQKFVPEYLHESSQQEESVRAGIE